MSQEPKPSPLRWLWRQLSSADTRSLGLFRIGFGVLLLTDLFDRIGGRNFVAFFTNDGLLPNHYALFRPPAPGIWGLLFGFSTQGEMAVAFTVIAGVYVLYLVGWRTRLMQVLALLCLESVNWRFLLPQHGGNVVMNILAVWTLFLPLGERFSLDALIRSLRAHPEADVQALQQRAFVVAPTRHQSLAVFGLTLNFFFIYLFNAAFKVGPAWLDGTAVHYVLWIDRMATPFAGWLRQHEPFFFSPMATWGALLMEWTLVVSIISPWKQRITRGLVPLVVVALHGGISSMLTLGPFSYSMMCFSLTMPLEPQWAWVQAKLKRPRFAATVRVDPRSPTTWLLARVLARLDWLGHLSFVRGDGALEVERSGQKKTGLGAWAWAVQALPFGVLFALPLQVPVLADGVRALIRLWARWAREGGVGLPGAQAPRGPLTQKLALAPRLVWPALVLVAVLSQLWMESMRRVLPPSMQLVNRPQLLTWVIETFQIPQGWSMFAPDPIRDDHRLVIDATLTDGTHVDPLTGQPPDFEPWKHGPWGFDQHWGEMHGRMHQWGVHFRNFKDYLYRLPALEGWPAEQRIVALEVWDVGAKAPLPGSLEHTEPFKRKLFDQNVP